FKHPLRGFSLYYHSPVAWLKSTKQTTRFEEHAMERELLSNFVAKKKQRTNCPRRVRSRISPILRSTSFDTSGLDVEVSCDSSSRVTAESCMKKRKLADVEEEPFRRITRSYSRQKEKEKETISRGNEVAEVSETSCVESNSGVDCVVSSNGKEKRSLKLKETTTIIEADDSASVSKSQACPAGNLINDISCEILDNDAVSFVSGVVESCSRSRAETELSDVSAKQQPNTLLHGLEPGDLACTESFAYGDAAVSDYSSSLSDFLEGETSSGELDYFSDFSPSSFLLEDDSGSQFTGDDESSPASRTYSLLLGYRKQFSRSTTTPTKTALLLNLETSSFARFEDEEEQESYERLLQRERRQVFLHDYTEFYASTTDSGDLIRKQRSQMVHWIVEQSTAKELQLETMFLGVSLLDRQRNFYVGSTEYSRHEVVAMEWLVQEVHLRTQEDDLRECVKSLEWLLQYMS
ncbi:hypothetical protein Tsubulata_047143, partial [Turnera subulata]